MDPQDALAHDFGDPLAVRDLVTTFLAQLPGRLDELRSAVDHDEQWTRRVAHTVKSTAQLLGAQTLATAARDLEHGDGSPRAVLDAAAPAARELRRWLATGLV